ncbi:hypothetical protein STRATTON_286 [Erwinia phage vB_EamM_Stratton]|uniref:Uncharacterized protein n=1 Tax=Erwinia phage vB_EamM_Stratton TaxID=1883378 RepID=A0A1B2IHE9_9CAUD|nr:hypothetical protein STRATTON_286 [Erwinia phage vB_EamM_Stratton]
MFVHFLTSAKKPPEKLSEEIYSDPVRLGACPPFVAVTWLTGRVRPIPGSPSRPPRRSKYHVRFALEWIGRLDRFVIRISANYLRVLFLAYCLSGP